MRATESTTITVHMLMWHAERIRDQFKRLDIGRILDVATQEAKRKDKQQEPDPAKVPVTVELTLKQVRTILAELWPLTGAPADRECYEVVKKAIDGID